MIGGFPQRRVPAALPSSMLHAITALFFFQLLGELLVQWLRLPFPGALAGMLLLLVALLALGRVPDSLERVAAALLQNMMLLFIPSVAAVMLHFDLLRREWLPFAVAGVAGAAITLVVTAWTLRRLLRSHPAALADAPGQDAR